MPVSISLRFCIARLVQNPHIAAGIVAILVAAAAGALPTWAQGPQNIPGGQSYTEPTAAPSLNMGDTPNVITKTGMTTRVAMAWDCSMPDKVPVVWARADHGSIAISPGTGPQCGRPSITLAGIFYTSAPGFKGTDKVYVMGYLLSGSFNNTYTILVK